MKAHTTLENVVKGFANKHRIAMLVALARAPYLDVDTLAQRLSIGYKTTAVHLAKMYDAGLIEKEYEGSYVVHSLTQRGKQTLQFLKRM